VTADAVTAHLTCEIRDGVAQVRLDRPDKLNGLTLPMLHGLVATARELSEQPGLRAVVLAGNGPSFCAGLDFTTVLPDQDGVERAFAPLEGLGTNTFQEACWAWRRLPVPVVAVVHGHCLGAGVQLALGADFRFTSPDARWSVLEGKWGLVPDMTGIRTLAEQVGKDTAKRLVMTAEWLDGAEAARLGLATESVEDPDAAASALVDQLLSRSPDALAAAKNLFERTWTSGPEDTFALEREAQGRLLGLPNTRRAQEAALRGALPAYEPRGS
jgi:enoyl-CoA hydratase/carnithine racemase